MCMIGCAGPTTPSEIRMYHTLVVAPAFLAIYTIGPSATVLRYNLLFIQISATCTVPYDRTLSIVPARSTDRAGALPAGSYALPNSLAVCCLYHWLHNGVWVDGSTCPLFRRDGVARAR
jgi:hypothetical protein